MSDDHRSADEREFERFLTSLRRQGDRLRRVRTEEAAVIREAGILLPLYDALVARNPGRFRMPTEDLETITYFSPADVDEARARADARGPADPDGDDYEEMSDADLARAVIAGGFKFGEAVIQLHRRFPGIGAISSTATALSLRYSSEHPEDMGQDTARVPGVPELRELYELHVRAISAGTVVKVIDGWPTPDTGAEPG